MSPKPKNLLGVRHLQFALMFFSMIIFLGLRTALSVAIIAMTESEPPEPSIPTYPDWDNTNVILSSFYWGYIMLQVIAGQLGERFGPKWFLVVTMTIGSIFFIIVPQMAQALGPTGVIICQVIQGVNQGFMYPSVNNMISKWAPLYERTQVFSVVYGGPSLGTVAGMLLTGVIAGSSLGWPYVFYIYGGVGLVWGGVFAIFASDSPGKHPTISEEERLYIESSNSISTGATKKIPTPWTSIVTSLPLWAILITCWGQSWGYFILLTEIPSYMSNIMDFDIKDNSELSSLPYVVMFVLCLISGPIADRVISRKTLSISWTRKISNLLGTMLPAASLFYLGFVNSSQKTLATILLIVAVATTAFTHSGSLVNLIDIAPNHAGTIQGIVNGSSTIFSIVGPLTVDFFGNDKKDPMLWRKVFWLAAAVYVGCGLFYEFFASGEVQKWNDLGKEEESDQCGVEHEKEGVSPHY